MSGGWGVGCSRFPLVAPAAPRPRRGPPPNEPRSGPRRAPLGRTPGLSPRPSGRRLCSRSLRRNCTCSLPGHSLGPGRRLLRRWHRRARCPRQHARPAPGTALRAQNCPRPSFPPAAEPVASRRTSLERPWAAAPAVRGPFSLSAPILGCPARQCRPWNRAPAGLAGPGSLAARVCAEPPRALPLTC